MASKDRGERRYNPAAVPTALHLSSLLATDSSGAFAKRTESGSSLSILALPSSGAINQASFESLAGILRDQHGINTRMKENSLLQSSGWDILAGHQGSKECSRLISDYKEAVRQGSRGARGNLAGEVYADIAYKVTVSSREGLVFDPNATVDFLHELAFKDRDVVKIPFGRKVIRNVATPDGVLLTEEDGVMKLTSVIDYKASISEPKLFQSQHEKYLAMLDDLSYRAPEIVSGAGIGIEYVLPFPDGQFTIPDVPVRKPPTVFSSLGFDSTQFSIFIDGIIAKNRPSQGAAVFIDQSHAV